MGAESVKQMLFPSPSRKRELYLRLFRWSIMLRGLRNHPARLWHWAARWSWFAVLTGGAVGALTFGEYALGMGLLILSAFSLTSKLWHKYDNGFLRVVGALAITVALIVLLSIAWDIKGDTAWSHIPSAWRRLTGYSENCKLFKASLGGALGRNILDKHGGRLPQR